MSQATPSRTRKTSPQVHFWDRAIGMFITVGGIFVIFAVLGICVFLATSVLPLFRAGELRPVATVEFQGATRSAAAAVSDEYRSLLVCVDSQGSLTASHIATGKKVLARQLGAPGATVTVVSFDQAAGLLALGRSDGSVQLGSIGFNVQLLTDREVDATAKAMIVGDSLVKDEAVITRVALEQFRSVSLNVELRDPTPLPQGSGPVQILDYRSRGSSEFLFGLRKEGNASLNQVSTIRPLGGGAPRVRLTDFPIALKRDASTTPSYGFVSSDGTSIFLLYPEGRLERYSAKNPESTPIALAETLSTLPSGRHVTAASMALGGISILVGDDSGTLTSACPSNDPGSTTPDGLRTVITHVIPVSNSPIVCFGLGVRDRSVAVGNAVGSVTVVNVTSEKTVAVAQIPEETGPVAAAVLTPKFDALIALGSKARAAYWELEPGHPEASFTSLFRAVHYEGAIKPGYVYQSTSGDDASEPKLSLIPLIFGTIKATIFSMLFAAPIGILAAIFTSEFVKPGTRKYLKPSIEMMASLPSVVLGFITALVVAPVVAANLPVVLLCFLTVPLGVMFSGHLWQTLPPLFERRLSSAVKLACIGISVLLGLGIAAVSAEKLEGVLFRPSQSDKYVATGFYTPVAKETVPSWVGARTQMSPDDERRLRIESGMYMRDGAVVVPRTPANAAEEATYTEKLAASQISVPSIRSWLDGNMTPVWPGWFLVCFPVGAVIAGLIERGLKSRGILAGLDQMPRSTGSILYAVKFVVQLMVTFASSFLLAIAISTTGLDARDSIFGPFSQSNTLMVGIMMGFAIIPIIFTISEDAMRSVPAQLRTASIGAGGTPWQTAWLVVVPVAASGIFSAVMIGLGRATGETMIIVMATGNTPSTSWNIFSGLRTLSANIAVELPEAAQGSTHYRVLFLCGLVLFVMTFILNTTAEIVRQRVRRKIAAL